MLKKLAWVALIISSSIGAGACAGSTPAPASPATASPATASPATASPTTASPTAEAAAPPAAGYDAALAQRLGADEYGMAKYVVAFLKRGPSRDQSKEEGARLMKAHLANIGKMAEEGKLVVAGPFLDDGELRGIYIFKVATVEEAQALTATDPAVQAGRLAMELHPWYGSAALIEVNAIHKRLEKTSITK